MTKILLSFSLIFSLAASAILTPSGAAGGGIPFVTPTNGDCLVGNGTAWLAGSCSTGSGTVTSVALTVPAIMSISGSPITSSGTLAVSLANESANLVWAGPSSGSAASPTFRALVAADLPTLHPVWGNITGTLSSQSDLQSALNAKQNSITTGSTSQYLRGDLSLATLNTAVVPESSNLYYTNARVDTEVATLVGTTAGKIVALNGSAQLPAVSGALLTNLPGSFSSYSVATTNNSATTLATIALSASSSYTCKGIISGYRTNGSDYAHFEVNGSVHSDGSSNCSFEDSTIIYQKASDVGFTSAWACSSTNIVLNVTGNTSKNIDWKGSVLCTSVN